MKATNILTLVFLMLFIIIKTSAQQYQILNNSFNYTDVEMSGSIEVKSERDFICSAFDTLNSIKPPGTFPTGITWDGEYLWNCDLDSLMIYRLSVTGDVISSFPVPSNVPAGLEWDGNYLWLVDEQTALLYKIDTTTGLPIEQFNLPSFGQIDPNGFGLAWDGQFLWHSEYGGSAMIYKIDPQNGQVISSFIPPRKHILGITWAKGYLYGVNISADTTSGGIIYQFEPSTGSVLDSALWPIRYSLGLVRDGDYFWNVESHQTFQNNERIYKVSNPITSVYDKFSNVANSFILSQNYPNPFNPVTNIQYAVSSMQVVTLKVYDLLGREVATLVNKEKPAGTYEVDFDGGKFPSGVYFYQLKAGKYSETKKMVLMK